MMTESNNITPQTITDHLAICAKEADVELLYACESGSRAWGFPSPDSDYDVRFIYRHSADWYLHLESQPDAMDWFARNNELDFSGWDLKKTLTLFATCNLSLNEHLQSPIAYLSELNFVEELREKIPEYFLPVKAVHHYFSQAQKHWDSYQTDGQMKIKRFFYIFRPLLACVWIEEFASMPPTEFAKMLEQPTVSTDLRSVLLELIEQKRTTNEREVLEISPFLMQEIQTRLEVQSHKLETIASFFPMRDKKTLADLNAYFLRWIK